MLHSSKKEEREVEEMEYFICYLFWINSTICLLLQKKMRRRRDGLEKSKLIFIFLTISQSLISMSGCKWSNLRPLAFFFWEQVTTCRFSVALSRDVKFVSCCVVRNCHDTLIVSRSTHVLIKYDVTRRVWLYLITCSQFWSRLTIFFKI